MNSKLVTRFVVAVAVLVVSSPVVSVAQHERAGEQLTGLSREVVSTQAAVEPGWPMPDKPIPYHRPGHASAANAYTTQVEMLGDDGLMETVTLSGVDAMVADGLDPLAGNHTLVSWDQLLRGVGDRGEVQTFSIVTEDDDGTVADERTISPEPGSLLPVGDRSLKIAGGDLNGDDQAEQVAAWLDGYDQVNLSIGELPGSFGRATSAPAVIAVDGALPNSYALNFDGVDDYVAVGTGINLANASFTVAFWAKRDVIDKDAFVVGQLDASPSVNTALHIGFRNNNLFTCAFLANDLDTPVSYTDTGWHHWACTYDAATNLRTIYRDGVEVAHDVASADYQGSGPLNIGKFGNFYFDGLIDEVGIWNEPRRQIQIQADMVRSTPDVTALEAYWPLNGGAGSTTAVDISDNEHNGTLVSEPTWSESHAPAGDLHVLVRGYDQALWHGAYEVDTGRCLWEREGGGGLMLSSPAVVPLAAGQFEVYAILSDMLTYRRAWNGSTWSASWELVDDPTYWQPLDSLVPVPNLAAPAVVRHDGEVDIFRLGPDNTLRWRHSDDGNTWDPWENLGGMLASGPAAVSPSPDNVQAFAQGADGNLWAWAYNGTEGAWQLVELIGMAEGVTLASAPAVISPATGEIVVYARGSDDHLWKDHYDGSTWGLWSGGGDGEGTLASGVGAAVLGGETYLFALTDAGGLQIKRAGGDWAAFNEGLPSCCNITITGLTGINPSFNHYLDISVDVETGHFWGDGRSQIVVGVLRDATHLEIALFDLSTHQDATGFTPVKVNLSDYVVVSTNNIQAFALTTGDFLGGDGVDDVALIYVAGTKYFVQVLRFDRVTRTLAAVAAVEGATPDSAYDHFSGTLEIVSGDFDADGREEFACSMGWVRLYTRTGFLCTVPSQAFDFVTRIFDVDWNGATFTLKQFQLEGYWNSEHLTRDADYPSVSIALAAGDVVGDGVDRLVRTWPVDFADDYNECLARYPGRTDQFRRTGQVIELPKNADANANAWQVDGNGNLEGATNVDLPDHWWTSRSYADRLVVGDFDRDRVGEIVWYLGKYTSSPAMTTEVYKYDPTEATYALIVSVDQPWLGGLNDLATADFKAQSLRVGPPSYHIQNRVDSMVAVINVPPKHQDYVKFDDGSGNIRYELFEVGLGSYAQHAMSSGSESEMGIQSQRDWAVGGGLDSTVTMGSFYVNTSLEYSYGQNFVDAKGSISTTSFTQSAEASTSDKIVYFSTPYQVWEYPVMVDGSQQPADYIVVEFPVPAYSGNQAYTRAADTTKGDHIEAPWYRAGHQTYNAWSYDPIGEPSFPDYDPDQLIYAAPQSTGGGDTYAFSEGSTAILETEKTKTHDFSAEVGVGSEAGFNFLGAKFGIEVRAHVNGSYGSSDLQTEKLTTSESTDIMWALSDQTELARTFTIKSYGYWARAGYLVLDYQTLVPKAGDWNKYYSSPDPAFILPWAGFPYGSASVAPTPGLERFSPEIQVVPESAGVGETVRISATVRNFSNATAYDVLVRFCQEDPGAACAPGGAAHIAEVSIARLDRSLDGPVTVSVPWIASGAGKQRIYAVIDPENAFDEVHDEDDLINNNIAYTVLKVGAAGFVDHGVAAAEPYAGLRYDQGNDWTVAAYIPPGNLSEIVHFELRDAELSVPGAIGQPFELVSYEGEEFYEAPNYDLSLRPGSAAPPAVIALAQSDVSVATLKLYRATNSTGSAWAEARCDDHQIVRVSDQNRIYVPVCQAGLFVFATSTPGAVQAPVAAFSAAPTSGFAPLSVQFTDQSTNTPTSWLWDFGDGTTSTEPYPVHVYTAEGTYTVTLTATNAAGSDDVTRSDLINVTAGNRVYLPLVVR